MQLFLKVRLSQGILSQNDVLTFSNVMSGQERIDAIKNGLIKNLNDLLKPAQLAIKSRLCEDNNEEHFALINLIESEAAKYGL